MKKAFPSIEQESSQSDDGCEAQRFARPASARRKVRPRGLDKQIIPKPITELKPFQGNPRHHPEAQIARLMKNAKKIWTNPILVDEEVCILSGHARAEAARRLKMQEVPTITVRGLTEAEKRAIVIAENRLAEQAEWNFDALREHFRELIDIDFDVELTGFTTGEIDLLLDGASAANDSDPFDNVNAVPLQPTATSKVGDAWILDRHRLTCGSALDQSSYKRLLDQDLAQMVVTDPPFNVPIVGHAVGRGKVRHKDFAQASGELTSSEFTNFLATYVRLNIACSIDGSIHFHFMDWRHLPELLGAAQPLYSEWKNLLVWKKSNAGQGSFYRSQHELIAVFKNGAAPHINNFGLGAKGRYRTNVLEYPGVNSLHPARRGDLELHPTVKPVALIADLIRDCSKRNGIILDCFGGSGTTILAAERTGRIARLIELDPLYVDVAIRRWEAATSIPARHAESGLTFAELSDERRRNGPDARFGGDHG